MPFIKNFEEPTVLTIDKGPSFLFAWKKLKKNGFYKNTIHAIYKQKHSFQTDCAFSAYK